MYIVRVCVQANRRDIFLLLHRIRIISTPTTPDKTDESKKEKKIVAGRGKFPYYYKYFVYADNHRIRRQEHVVSL